MLEGLKATGRDPGGAGPRAGAGGLAGRRCRPGALSSHFGLETREAVKDNIGIAAAVARVGAGERGRWTLFEEYHGRNVTQAIRSWSGSESQLAERKSGGC